MFLKLNPINKLMNITGTAIKTFPSSCQFGECRIFSPIRYVIHTDERIHPVLNTMQTKSTKAFLLVQIVNMYLNNMIVHRSTKYPKYMITFALMFRMQVRISVHTLNCVINTIAQPKKVVSLSGYVLSR